MIYQRFLENSVCPAQADAVLNQARHGGREGSSGRSIIGSPNCSGSTPAGSNFNEETIDA
jgi:hypothetical protein